MTHREAIIFVHNCPKAEKGFYIRSLGEAMFNSFVSMGFLTTNVGMYYWTTRLFNDYYQDMFNPKRISNVRINKTII
jgi:hypothetical protein